MWVFNAVYMNMDTGKETVREIEFDGENMFEDDLEKIYVRNVYGAQKERSKRNSYFFRVTVLSKRRDNMRKNKPRWDDLDFYERLSRKCKRDGYPEYMIKDFHRYSELKKQKNEESK